MARQSPGKQVGGVSSSFPGTRRWSDAPAPSSCSDEDRRERITAFRDGTRQRRIDGSGAVFLWAPHQCHRARRPLVFNHMAGPGVTCCRVDSTSQLNWLGGVRSHRRTLAFATSPVPPLGCTRPALDPRHPRAVTRQLYV